MEFWPLMSISSVLGHRRIKHIQELSDIDKWSGGQNYRVCQSEKRS
jgi:hypothetical protein